MEDHNLVAMQHLVKMSSLLPVLRQAGRRLAGTPRGPTASRYDGLTSHSRLKKYNQTIRRSLTLSASTCRNSDPSGGRYTDNHTENQDDDDDDDGDDEYFMEDTEVDELFQQQVPRVLGDGEHRIFLVHPDVKWGSRKQYLTTGDHHIVHVTKICEFEIFFCLRPRCCR